MARVRGIWTLLQMVVTVSVVIVLMYLFRKKNKKIRQIWAAMELKLMGVELEIQGKEDPNAQMLILNHQSIVDIILFEYLSSIDLAWIAKQEIGDIPWFGHILKAPNMIMVKRESKSSLVKMLKESKKRIDQNRAVAIFPEGTRTDGTKMRKFKVGAKIIADKFELRVQPIVIVGSLHIWDSKRFIQNPGKVKVIYLDSVVANKKTNWYEQTEEKMKNILEKELKQ